MNESSRRPRRRDLPPRQTLQVAVTNEQTELEVPTGLLKRTIRQVLAGEGHQRARISVVIVDDPTIHQLNKQYLEHDYPTDVLSFLLSDPDETLEGEIIISADTALARAAEFNNTPLTELLLYAVHGTLHLCGFDDHDPADQAVMRAKEAAYTPQSNGQIPSKRAPKPH